MISQSNKLSKLESDKANMKRDLKEAQITLDKLQYNSEVEKYAREKKLFKKDDEDVFVIFYE